ncbi:MAG: SUMF1/EgtB/PvdO family nonheme iron enzyme [Betaproteobacteria bacterium]|nr:SUMF1/EgtB/PvdO family nonheme iron enzyme [Betaproteobacteria bacterium]
MNLDRIPTALPDTFALHEGELIALQVNAAHALGRSDTRFRDTLSGGSTAPELAVIPAGAFEYGAAPKEAAPAQDRPRRTALIERGFAIGVYPVTTEEFEAYARATGWRPRAELVWLSGRKPVINVRQTEARDYCAWLSKESGERYRLPTELEWEYACRAGRASAYAHGDRITPADALYNASQGFDATRPRRPRLLSRCFVRCGAMEVGMLRPNRWGLHDMAGNVWEFTASPWTRDHASLPERPGRGRPQAVVTKGGSWFDGPEDCRAAARRRRLENELDLNLGFRVAREM